MKNSIKVIVFTKYDQKGASSRLRSLQYFEKMRESGIKIKHSPLFNDEYLERRYRTKSVSSLYILQRYFLRFLELFVVWRYDVVWIEKELFPWLPLNIEGALAFMGVKYLVDYDDAIFHNYDLHKNKLVRILLQNKIQKVMKGAKVVTVCNDYLRKFAENAGTKNIKIIPTVVDLNKYTFSPPVNNEALTIGWIGTPITEKYIIGLMDILEAIAEKIKIKILLIGGENFHTKKFEYEILPWSEFLEVESLKKIDIGIMPLTNSKWEQGKCAYKLIQYMACSKPVIASRAGMNCELVENNTNGFIVETKEEWIEAFLNLNDKNTRNKMGENARKLVETKYSLQETTAIRVQSIRDTLSS